MKPVLTAAAVLTALAFTGLSIPSQALAACQTHAKAGQVCSDTPLYNALHFPKSNGR